MSLPQANLLSGETSPYLLQHQKNPVHWRPWSEQALEEARLLDRPILLSVGYAACHWCHVMAHESFEDAEVADVMNRLFVNIKVDREERPEIDQIYMAALSAMGEQGGWPLTMFLSAEGKPFWGGTYFPKRQAYGRPGFIDILKAVDNAWNEKRAELVESADVLSSHIKSRLSPAPNSLALAPEALPRLAEVVYAQIDHEKGGMRGAPKFPNAPFLQVLWLNWLQNSNSAHRDAVLQGLKHMLSGGIYDHVGGGLSRYATDDRWLVPHFEKMLYDNAQLLKLASWAYGSTGDDLFRIRIEETAQWLMREMQLPPGGFASSLDADSEGEEGLFYLWTRDQVVDVLDADAERFLAIFGLAQPEGWHGGPILHRLKHRDHLGNADEAFLRTSLDHLLDMRAHRVRPGCDNKVLVDWNGMAITALVDAGRVFNQPSWIASARDAFRFVCESMRDGRLPHSIGADKALFPAISSDYASMILAATSLYQATGEPSYLQQASAWLKMLEKWHGDKAGDGFYLTASDTKDLPMRIRGDIDEAIPSATAQIIEAFSKIATLTGDHSLYERSIDIAQAAFGRVQKQPHGQAGIIYAASLADRPIKLLMVEPHEEPVFVPVANQIADPRRVDIVINEDTETGLLPGDIVIDRSAPGAYLCIGQTCLPRLTDPAELKTVLLDRAY